MGKKTSIVHFEESKMKFLILKPFISSTRFNYYKNFKNIIQIRFVFDFQFLGYKFNILGQKQ
ncbi:MAG: hypothetical protein HQK76_04130 [Desulfobacterales bacterium]|nr:hypothetical protein [Desulfobacterales bacterium]